MSKINLKNNKTMSLSLFFIAFIILTLSFASAAKINVEHDKPITSVVQACTTNTIKIENKTGNIVQATIPTECLNNEATVFLIDSQNNAFESNTVMLSTTNVDFTINVPSVQNIVTAKIFINGWQIPTTWTNDQQEIPAIGLCHVFNQNNIIQEDYTCNLSSSVSQFGNDWYQVREIELEATFNKPLPGGWPLTHYWRVIDLNMIEVTEWPTHWDTIKSVNSSSMIDLTCHNGKLSGSMNRAHGNVTKMWIDIRSDLNGSIKCT